MVFEHVSSRTFLQATLATRMAENEGYSLRAFAQKLGFASSYISSVLSGKKSLSTDAALRIAVKLNLTELESQYLCLLAQLESVTDPEYRAILFGRLQALRSDQKGFDLSNEMFCVISDWCHFAILELTYLTGFVLSAESAAKKLGLSKVEAEAAIERLLRLELLEKTPSGKLRKTKDYVVASSNTPNAAIKKFHKQLLEKASSSLIEQTPHERISSTDILPIDSRHIGEFKRLTDEYTAGILKLSKKSKVKDQVYCLTVHIFNLTKNERVS